MIMGIPTVKTGLGFINRKDGTKEYVLIKEAVIGETFDEEKIKRSLSSMNIFNPKDRNIAKSQTQALARIISRVINSGLWVEDLHSGNLMISKNSGDLVVIDGTINEGNYDNKIDPSSEFGRTIGFPGGVGDIIFSRRYYIKEEPPPSPAAVERAKARIKRYFEEEPIPCDKITPNEDGFIIDVHKVFNSF